MEKVGYNHLLRLVCEAYAVLTKEQIGEMAVSMDLPRREVIRHFDEAEYLWEEVKDALASGGV